MTTTHRRSVARRFPHLRPLDGLRGLASLGVLAFHLLFTSVPPLPSSPWHLVLVRYVFSYGLYGVMLFFVLSGYLITSLLLLDRRKPNYYHNFYWKRAFRVLPPLLLVLAIAWFAHVIPVSGVAMALLFVMNFATLFHGGESGPFWSLSLEEQFYLVWPAVVRRVSAKRMRQSMVVIIVAEPILRFISAYLHHGRFHYTFVLSDGLAWGALLAIAAYSLRIPYRNYNQQRLWRQLGLPTFVAGAITMVIAAIVDAYGLRLFMLPIDGAMLFCAGLVCYFVAYPATRLGRFLSTPVMIFFGNISYMMYLTHQYIMDFYDLKISQHVHFAFATQCYVRFFVVLATTILWCTASLYLFERPINRLRRFVIKDQRTLPAA